MQVQVAIAPRLLNIQQVAAYLGLSVHTVYKFVSQRKIPHIKIGKLLKFDRPEIDRWIASHTVKERRSFGALTP
jgi:excisionase family DNA binding protein